MSGYVSLLGLNEEGTANHQGQLTFKQKLWQGTFKVSVVGLIGGGVLSVGAILALGIFFVVVLNSPEVAKDFAAYMFKGPGKDVVGAGVGVLAGGAITLIFSGIIKTLIGHQMPQA